MNAQSSSVGSLAGGIGGSARFLGAGAGRLGPQPGSTSAFIGDPASPSVPPAVPFDRALTELSTACDHLENATADIHQRLARVLRPYPTDASAKADGKSECRSDVTDKVWTSIDRLNAITRQLSAIYQALDV